MRSMRLRLVKRFRNEFVTEMSVESVGVKAGLTEVAAGCVEELAEVLNGTGCVKELAEVLSIAEGAKELTEVLNIADGRE